MKEDRIRVEIISPVHNRKELTLRCLRSLSHIDWDIIAAHIVIVDDGSTDGTTEEISRSFPNVEIVRGDGNLWYAGGTNRGIEAALKHDPDYILAINDDSIFHDQCLPRLIRCAESHPKSIVGALLLLWDRPHAVFQVGARWDTWYGGWRHLSNQTAWTVPSSPFDVEHIVGNCVLYPAEAIKKNGLMNESSLAHLTADIEYTIRMRRAGWRLVIEPKAYVWCQPNVILPSMRSLGLKPMLRELFLNSKSPKNLMQIFKARWHTAPNRMLGLLAFAITLIRLGLHFVELGGNWPYWPDLSIQKMHEPQ